MQRLIMLGLVAIVASCTQNASPSSGSQRQFLHDCDNGCAKPYSCNSGVCTFACETNDECTKAISDARCVATVMASAEESPQTGHVCDVECTGAVDCSSLGAEFGCVAGRCRTHASMMGVDASVTPNASETSVTADVSTAPDASTAAAVCGGHGMPAGITTLFFPDWTDPTTPNTGVAANLLVKDGYVYFMRTVGTFVGPLQAYGVKYIARGSLYRVPTCGGTVEDPGLNVERDLTGHTAVNEEDSNYDLFKLASGGHFVYVIGDEVRRVDVRDLTVVTMGVGTGCVTDAAANDADLFVYDRCNRQILRAAHGDTEFKVFSEADTGGLLAVDSCALYFTRGGVEVWRKSFDSTDPQPFYTARSNVLSIACDERAVVVVRDYDSHSSCNCNYGSCTTATVTRVPLDGGVAEDISQIVTALSVTSGLIAPGDAPDFSNVIGTWRTPIKGGQVYVRERGDDNVIQVARIGTDGLGHTPVLRRSHSFLAVDGERLYWTEWGMVFTALPQAPILAGPPADVTPKWTTIASKGIGTDHMVLAPDNSIVLLGRPCSDCGAEAGGRALVSPSPIGETPLPLLVKLAADGQYAWSAFLPVSDRTVGDAGVTHEAQPICLAVDGAGRIAAVTWEFGPETMALHRFESDGTVIETTRQAIESNPYEDCVSDSAGNLYLGGNMVFGSMLSHFEKKGVAGVSSWTVEVPLPPGVGGFFSVNMALAESGFVALIGGYIPQTLTVGGTNFASNSSIAVSVVRMTAEGDIVWSRPVTGGATTKGFRIATDKSGSVLLVGETADFVQAGNQKVSVPRPLERFTFLLRLANDGSVESLRLLDSVFHPGMADATLGPDGNIYLVVGETARPFYFGLPNTNGNYVYGVTFAKLDNDGNPIYSNNLSPYLASDLPSGILQLNGPHVAVASDCVFVLGSIMPSMPEGVCSNADPSALELAQTYDYLGFVAMFAP